MHTFVDFSHSFATDAHSRQKKPVELRMLKLTGLKNLETSESETGKHSWELNIFKLRWSRDFFASCVFVDVSFIKSNFGEFIRFFFSVGKRLSALDALAELKRCVAWVTLTSKCAMLTSRISVPVDEIRWWLVASMRIVTHTMCNFRCRQSSASKQQ